MSWLSEFTSKAENLLTKFDQTAAQTLNESGIQNTIENVVASGQYTTTNSPPETKGNKEYQNASQLFSSQPKQTTQVPTRNSTADLGTFRIKVNFHNFIINNFNLIFAESKISVCFLSPYSIDCTDFTDKVLLF